MPAVNYFWDEDEDNVIEEYDDAGETVATYTTEPTLHGRVISQNRGGVESFYHYDGEGNTRALTDINGDVTNTYDYDTFGDVTASTGNTTNPFGYKGALGYYANPETNDYYVRARNYEPTIARWLSADPIGFEDGMNLYAFVSNDPVNKVDPSGLECDSCDEENPVWLGSVEKAVKSIAESVEYVCRHAKKCKGKWKTAKAAVWNVWGNDKNAEESDIREDVALVNYILMQCCVRITVSEVKEVKKASAFRLIGGDYMLSTGRSGKFTQEVKNLFHVKSHWKDDGKTIPIFYLKALLTGGIVYGRTYRPTVDKVNSGIVIDRKKTTRYAGFERPRTLAHELYHWLSDDSGHVIPGPDNLILQGGRGIKLEDSQCKRIRESTYLS